jgi:hypothetical protein
MARDRLDALLRLRRLAVHDGIRGLAASIRAEAAAYRQHAACTAAMAREIAEARSLAACDAALTRFAMWHPQAARALADADTQVKRAGELTRTAQALLGDARGDMRAVELALARRQAETDLATQRSAQHALDDAARRPGIAKA